MESPVGWIRFGKSEPEPPFFLMVKTMVKAMVSGYPPYISNISNGQNPWFPVKRAQLDHRGAVADHQGGHFQGHSNDVRWLIYGYHMVIKWLIIIWLVVDLPL